MDKPDGIDEATMRRIRADLAALKRRADDPAARRDARFMCRFFGSPVPEWAERRNKGKLHIVAKSKAGWHRQYYRLVTKPRRQAARAAVRTPKKENAQ